MTDKIKKFIVLIMVLALVLPVLPISGSYAHDGGIQGKTNERSEFENPYDSANQNKPTNKQLQAVTETYINLPMLEGEQVVSGVINAADWASTNNNVATFENGKILAHGEGIAVVTIDNSTADRKTFYVSSYYSYPQPKKSLVFDSVNSRYHGNRE